MPTKPELLEALEATRDEVVARWSGSWPSSTCARTSPTSPAADPGGTSLLPAELGGEQLLVTVPQHREAT